MVARHIIADRCPDRLTLLFGGDLDDERRGKSPQGPAVRQLTHRRGCTDDPSTGMRRARSADVRPRLRLFQADGVDEEGAQCKHTAVETLLLFR
jgi:hypothetical protein